MGPVMGPLVIAGVLGSRPTIKTFAEIGVNDSKILSARERETLAHEIRKRATAYVCIELSPQEIDKAVANPRKSFKLNYLEAKFMAKAIGKLRPHTAFVDSCDIFPARFSAQISSFLKRKVRIIAEHGADEKRTIVGAASILAKTTRDQRIAELAGLFGDLGSGYPSDKRTISFLRNWLVNHDDFPDFVRRSWVTARRIKAESCPKQLTLHKTNELED